MGRAAFVLARATRAGTAAARPSKSSAAPSRLRRSPVRAAWASRKYAKPARPCANPSATTTPWAGLPTGRPASVVDLRTVHDEAARAPVRCRDEHGRLIPGCHQVGDAQPRKAVGYVAAGLGRSLRLTGKHPACRRTQVDVGHRVRCRPERQGACGKVLVGS